MSKSIRRVVLASVFTSILVLGSTTANATQSGSDPRPAQPALSTLALFMEVALQTVLGI